MGTQVVAQHSVPGVHPEPVQQPAAVLHGAQFVQQGGLPLAL